jgi:hypothetical protein
MNSIVVRRNGQYMVYGPDEFWSLCTSSQFLRSDEIFAPERNQFLRADQFSDVAPSLPKSIGEIIGEIIGGALVLGTVVVLSAGAVSLLESLFATTAPARRKVRVPNQEPLEKWKKELVRVRDRETCTYCGYHDPWGHVDHKTSRANGGSNLLRNLVWACSFCNCSKGRMNAAQFKRLNSVS